MFNFFNSAGNSQNSFFSGLNFADYASIRNGSYNKLMKAYYAKNDSSGSSGSSSAGTRKAGEKNYWDYNEKIKNAPKKEYNYWNYNEKIKGESSPGKKFADIANAASSVKSSADAMEKAGEITYEAVSGYVNKYNELVQAAKNSSNAAINSSMRSISDYTKSNEKALAAIGITIDSGSKTLTLDKEKLKEAGVEKVKELFTGGYGKTVNDRASAISSHANHEINKGGMYSSSGIYNYNVKSAFSAFQ